MAAFDSATAAELLPGQYAAVAVSTVGLGLVVGAWWGRARWLILIGLLLAAVAIASSFITVPLDAGWGDRKIQPTSADQLQDEYELAAGRLTLDLSDLPSSMADREISATIGMGRLRVILPDDARAQVRSEVGAGTSDLFGAIQEGTDLERSGSHDGTGSTFVLSLEVGVGSVLVSTASEGE